MGDISWGLNESDTTEQQTQINYKRKWHMKVKVLLLLNLSSCFKVRCFDVLTFSLRMEIPGIKTLLAYTMSLSNGMGYKMELLLFTNNFSERHKVRDD